MNQEIEIECKNLLTEIEYQRLLDYFELTNLEPTLQINHYFETPDFALKQKGSALRIRAKQNHYTLTLKQPFQDGLLETHDSLLENQVRLWLNNKPIFTPHVGIQLEKIGIKLNQLKYGGALETARIEVYYHESLVVLDKSRYNGTVDYELEVESDQRSKAESTMDHLIERLALTRKETPNKIERFYRTLDL
ncbi:CYTH domain-containing protein [Amphibacillus sediminis]|uniref:CYTH domain-containing protein n=1 Tax=Amphibacillus sediminis TaxID=360185 RepID=UPI00082A09D9|nr:CYTH domain-containing protein [Amphibacillus sediminis]